MEMLGLQVKQNNGTEYNEIFKITYLEILQISGGNKVERSYDAVPAGGEQHYEPGRQPSMDQLSQDYLDPTEERGYQQGGADSKQRLTDQGNNLEAAELKEGGVLMERSYGHTHVYHDHVHNHTNEHDHEHKVKFHQNQARDE